MYPAISMEERKLARSSSVSFSDLYKDTVWPAVQKTADDPKTHWRQGLQLSAKSSVQQNWARIQAEEHEQFASWLVPQIGRRRSPSEASEGPVLVDQLLRGLELLRGREAPPDLHQKVIQAFNEPQEAPGLQECLARITSWLNPGEKLISGSHQGAPEATPKVVVLERLEGYVDRIEGATAYVTLKSQYGDELTGEYASHELAARGITEGRRFYCETVEVDGAVRVLFEAVPEKPVSKDEEDAIRRRIAELVQGGELDGDY